jgi:HPt (histidine-containing phosphotransfer) domain-containing protein
MTPDPQTPVFDPGPFSELLEVGGPELVNELAQLFLDETPELIDAIEAAAASEDWEALTRAAHTLKSSAFYLGALALSEQAKELEHHSGAGAHEAAAALAAGHREAYEAASAALAQACAGLPPA